MFLSELISEANEKFPGDVIKSIAEYMDKIIEYGIGIEDQDDNIIPIKDPVFCSGIIWATIFTQTYTTR